MPNQNVPLSWNCVPNAGVCDRCESVGNVHNLEKRSGGIRKNEDKSITMFKFVELVGRQCISCLVTTIGVKA